MGELLSYTNWDEVCVKQMAMNLEQVLKYSLRFQLSCCLNLKNSIIFLFKFKLSQWKPDNIIFGQRIYAKRGTKREK